MLNNQAFKKHLAIGQFSFCLFLSRLRSRSETYVLLFRRRCRRRRRRRRKLFCILVIFSETITARAMKLGSCIHLEELSSTLCSV